MKHIENNNIYTTQLQYWIDKEGYSEKDARKMLKERQSTFSLEKCINKYGPIEGVNRFKKRQAKWIQSLHNNNKLTNGYSQISQDLFNTLINFYDENDKKYIYFGQHNGEFLISDDIKTYLYDFVDIKNKKIIEFNGDFFHANPLKYKKDDIINIFGVQWAAEDIWKKDQQKKDYAINNGYDILYVWESNYKNNIQQTIKICKKFLNLK